MVSHHVYMLLQQLIDQEKRRRMLLLILSPLLFLLVVMMSASDMGTTSGVAASPLSAKVEQWRPTVEKYCKKYKMDGYVDLVLALMQVESSGNEPDPMQAGEGAYWEYCVKSKDKNGGHSNCLNGIPKGHGECSINAGVQELRDALKAANVESPYDIDHIKVAIQGYNYGMSRWISWIKKHGGKYTLALSQQYSRTEMPAGAKGTPDHAEKVMKYYSIATGDSSAEVLLLDGNSGLKVVYYNQGDAAWKSLPYSTSTIGDSGCGPTSMAICISTLSGKKVTPRQTCTWAGNHGYYVKGSGSMHSVIPGLAKQYKVKCKGVGKSKTEIVKALKSGKLVVAIMAKGHFTDGGHFIVLTGIKDGKITVADCGSRARTKQTWSLDLIVKEARSGADAGGPFWVISKK